VTTYLKATLKKSASVTARALTPGKPHHAQWLVTRKCNYKCRGCNVWKEQDQKELTTDEIKKGFDILKKMGIVELVISGGDPLLREDIGEIIDYATKLFITTVYDNGSLAEEKIDLLRKADFVAISIDSLNEAKHDYLKNTAGAWKSGTQAVEVLHREGIQVAVTPTISQKNLTEIIDLTKYYTAKGIPVWYCLYSYDTSMDSKQLFRIGKETDDLVITDKQGMVNLCNQLLEMKKNNKHILMTDKLLVTLRSLYEKNSKRMWKCQALNQFLVVDHLGRVAGCHSHNFAGSIFDLPEKWKSPQFKRLRKNYHKCTQCSYLCYVAYSLHGSPIGHLSLAKDQWKNAKLLFK
jgi:AdoMet-dependent heme synthase